MNIIASFIYPRRESILSVVLVVAAVVVVVVVLHVLIVLMISVLTGYVHFRSLISPCLLVIRNVLPACHLIPFYCIMYELAFNK